MACALARCLAVAAVTLGCVPAAAAGAWSAPQDLPAEPRDLFDGLAGLGLAADGTAIALTDVGAADPGRQVSIEQPPDAPWRTPIVLGPGRAGRLAFAGDGTALAVWSSRGFLAPTSDVFAARRGADGSWSPREAVATAIQGGGSVEAVTVNAGGAAVASVVHGDDRDRAVYARQPGGSWAPLDPAPAAPWAHFAIQDSGALLAVWRGDAPDRSAGQGPVTAAERAGGAFGPLALPAGTPTVHHLQVSGSPDGDALVVGTDVSRLAPGPGGQLGALIALRPRGGGFSEARVVPAAQVAPGMGADGTAVAAWLDRPLAAPRAAVRVVLREPGGGLGTPVALGTVPGTHEISGPGVGVGPDGTAVVAWSSRRRGGPGAVWASIRRPGGRFAPARLVNDRLLPAVVGHASAGRDGSALVTWTESTGRSYVVQAARAEPAPLVRSLAARVRGRLVRVTVRLGRAARVVLSVRSPAGVRLARAARSLRAGRSAVALRLRGRPPAGRLRVQALAAGGRRSAGASALVVPTPAR